MGFHWLPIWQSLCWLSSALSSIEELCNFSPVQFPPLRHSWAQVGLSHLIPWNPEGQRQCLSPDVRSEHTPPLMQPQLFWCWPEIEKIILIWKRLCLYLKMLLIGPHSTYRSLYCWAFWPLAHHCLWQSRTFPYPDDHVLSLHNYSALKIHNQRSPW